METVPNRKKQQYDGGHSCTSCKNPCHTFCGEPVGKEGFGKPVLCFNCKDMNPNLVDLEANKGNVTFTNVKTTKARNKQSETSVSIFSVMMKNRDKTVSSKNPVKRKKSGHQKTTGAVCLACYNLYKTQPQWKKKFCFTRYNESSMKEHMKTHRDVSIDNYSNYFVAEDNPKAGEAVKANKSKDQSLLKSSVQVQTDESRKPDDQADLRPTTNCPDEVPATSHVSMDTRDKQAAIESQSAPGELTHAESAPSETTAEKRKVTSISVEDHENNVDWPSTKLPKMSSSLNSAQASITNFLLSDPSAIQESGVNLLSKKNLDYIVDRISGRIIGSSKHSSQSSGSTCTNLPSCTNLTSFLESESHDYELISGGEVHDIRCNTCFTYINDPVALSELPRKPSFALGTSLISGLVISNNDYKLYCNGGCQKWYNFKSRLLNYIIDASQTLWWFFATVPLFDTIFVCRSIY
ncbi:Hypothetical predicted protein [Paramuricea clavata]|uniref:SCAN domain-containing protein n=1 Tax=Paramuricea clavata TaxID=317549 RepID=A0A6S7JPI7_PARCT|nr:Hypothetical predicted protein [Paramuricea clavata]